MSGTNAARAAIRIVPVGLRVQGRRVLVVGAGPIAARKAAVYVDGGAHVVVVAPVHSDQMQSVVVAERIVRGFQGSDLDGVWLVVAATGDPTVDGEVFRQAEKRQLWCNAADDPDHCSAILPAVAKAGDVTVAISTGGRSPAAASWLRRRIQALLDDDTIAVAEVAATVRSKVRDLGLSTEVDGWAQVLDDNATAVVATDGPDALERRLFDAVTNGRT